jgi:D-serine deaminase-like pyridoxal phosphate-dependent protein
VLTASRRSPDSAMHPSLGLVLERLSEEHGVITAVRTTVVVGDRLRFQVNHACTVANLAHALVGVRDGHVEEVMPILVGGGGR